MHIFALISKLKQLCNFGPNKEISPKTVELLDLVEQIKENGQKVLVFSQYDTEGVGKLENLLRPFGVSLIKGGLSDNARNSAISEFKKNKDICVFLATIKTGGVGLTLTEASYVIHFDHWWNPALMWQADDRVHRTGQKSSQVNIYSFWTQDTIEERIYAVLKEKHLLFDEVINGLSVEDVDEMISTDEWLNILGIKSKPKPSAKPGASSSDDSGRTSAKPQSGTTERPNEGNQQHRSSEKSDDSKRGSYPRHRPEVNISIGVAHLTLGVVMGASSAEISAAYRNLAKRHHPDKAVNSSDTVKRYSEAKMRELNNAFLTLRKHKFV